MAVLKTSTGTVIHATLSPLLARAIAQSGHGIANKIDFTDISLIFAKDSVYSSATAVNRINLGILEDIRQVPAFYPPF